MLSSWGSCVALSVKHLPKALKPSLPKLPVGTPLLCPTDAHTVSPPEKNRYISSRPSPRSSVLTRNQKLFLKVHSYLPPFNLFEGTIVYILYSCMNFYIHFLMLLYNKFPQP